MAMWRNHGSSLATQGRGPFKALARLVVAATIAMSVGAAGAWSGVLWSGARVDDWVSTAISGRAYVEDVVHLLLGPAVRLVNEEVDGTHNAGARINWEGFDPDYVMPTEAWYSVTVLVPYFVDGQNNVFQFKQRNGDTDEHLWNLGWRPVDGVLRFIVRSRLEGSTWVPGPSEVAVLETEVPIGTPFRIDVFRRMSVEDDGRYEVLVNGETVWAFDGVTIADNLDTPVRKGHHWAMSHYFGDWQGVVEPRTSHIFVTDAAITTTPPESYERTFIDIRGRWSESVVEGLRLRGLVSGCHRETARFCPTRAVTRAEFVHLLVESLSLSSTTDDVPVPPDVPADAWYTQAVLVALSQQVFTGYADSTFRPMQPISRAEAAAVVGRSLGLVGGESSGPFMDVDSQDWFAPYVNGLFKHDLLLGWSDTGGYLLCPSRAMSREEAAALVIRTIGHVES